jgi:hypothetical protein
MKETNKPTLNKRVLNSAREYIIIRKVILCFVAYHLSSGVNKIGIQGVVGLILLQDEISL